MINFNAAQISVNVLGLPVQQNSNTISSGNNNFRAIIESLLNNQTVSERAVVASAISTDQPVKTALFESVAILYLTGKIESMSGLSKTEIMNDPAVSAVVSNNNLNSIQAQLLASGIKITSLEIASGNLPLLKSSVVQESLTTLQLPVPAENASALNPAAQQINTAVENTPTALPEIKNKFQLLNHMNAAGSSVSVPQTPAVFNSTVQAVTLAQETTKPSQPVTNAAVVSTGENSITSKNETPSAVIPVLKRAPQPEILNSLTGKNQDAVNLAAVISNSTSEESGNIVNELRTLIKDFTALIYKLAEDNEDNKELTSEVKIISAKLSDLADKIDLIKTAGVKDASNISGEAADILAVISAAIYRLENISSGVPAAAGAVNKIGEGLVTGSGTAANNDNSGNRQVVVSSGLNDAAKDLISKIYGLLQKMNGELYVSQKTDYVYKPFSGSSSQVTKDGVLLVNTALTTGSPEVIVNTQSAANGVIVQPAIASEVLETLPAVISTGAVLSNSKINLSAANAAAVITEDAGVQPELIPAVSNSEKAAMLLSDSKNRQAMDIDWLKDNTASYIAAVPGTKNAQLPVNVQVFEKAADFAVSVKENIVIKQVVQNIQDAVKVTGRTEIKMFLRPENMGPVVISLDSREGIISGRIEAANADVKDILKIGLPELKAALSSVGLNVGSMDVSLMSNYIGNNLSDSSNNQYREWESAGIRPDAEETLENAGSYTAIDGYLNFLA